MNSGSLFIDATSPVIVAYSGGADSTALLLMAHEAQPGRVAAVHVHHGLQAAADDFAAHAQAFCSALNIPLTVLKVDAKAAPGQSPEDAARRARYAAISTHVLGQKVPLAAENSAQLAINSIANKPLIVLAQHADDQVETLLLALSRGAGVAGMAGMAARFERYGLQWARPFITPEHFMGAADIRHWLRERGLVAREPFSGQLGQGWVEDPSNASPAFTRNRIRAELLPALEKVFPQYRQTMARTARNMALAAESIEEFAIELIAKTGSPPRIAALRALPPQQQSVVLRHWLNSVHGVAGSEAQLAELLRQLAACRTRGHAIDIKFAAGKIVRCGEALSYQAS